MQETLVFLIAKTLQIVPGFANQFIGIVVFSFGFIARLIVIRAIMIFCFHPALRILSIILVLLFFGRRP